MKVDHCHTLIPFAVRSFGTMTVSGIPKYSFHFLRTELIAIVRHLQAYPNDELDDTLRNVFDFDVYRIETNEKLDEILRKHGSVVHAVRSNIVVDRLWS